MTKELALRDQARRAVNALVPSDANRSDVEPVRRKALKALDAQITHVPRTSLARIACAKGCSLCCHLRVMATPAEVIGLAAFMRQTLPPARLEALTGTIAASAAAIRAVPVSKLLSTNIACPLLLDGACSMYAARPFNCRAYHSLDYQACLDSFNHPDDHGLGHPQSALLSRVNEGVQQGFIDVLDRVDADKAQYELVTALDETFHDPEVPQRFMRGEAAFRAALKL